MQLLNVTTFPYCRTFNLTPNIKLYDCFYLALYDIFCDFGNI